jgi:eukaryotic-like serine/threonine-protein kinase
VVQAILPIGTVLNGQYIVESLLGKGSFGNVYLARDQDDKQKLFALAELINPKDQKGYRFTLEYVSHTPPSHRALPQTQSVFTDDKLGRKCLLVSYSEEPHLEILRLQQPQQRFPLPQVMTIMAPIMSAVSHLHHRHPPVIHQNVKPTSILVPRTTGEPVLVVLGIVKKQGFTTNPVPYFAPCYGAIEQYRGEFSTRSDIYGLGATFYILLTGLVPPDALFRSTQLDSTGIDLLKPVNEVVPTIPTVTAEAIQKAMALEDDHRFSSVEQFWEALWSLGEYPSSVPGDMRSAFSHTSRVPRQAVVRPATIFVPKQPRIRRNWKFGRFWPFAPKHRHAPQAGEPAVVEQTDTVGESRTLAPPHPAGAIMHIDKLIRT